MNVLITGAAGGLGRALATECASRGFNLVLTDRHTAPLEAVKTGITRRYGVEVHTCACNLRSEAEVSALFDTLQGRRFDMLFNVAGLDFEGGFSSRSAGQIASIIELNISATLRVTHHMLQRRPEGQALKIVFISSLASLYPMPLKACYAASKRFLYDFAYALGSELKGSGVSITTVCPGGLATTDEAITGIAVQGLWGRLTQNRIELVARRTVAKALRGRKLYIPGVVNRALVFCGKIVPRALITSILRSRWRKAGAQRQKAVQPT